MTLTRRTCISAATAGLLAGGTILAQPSPDTGGSVDETWFDTQRQREVLVKIRWPDATAHPGLRSVVIFSHGLGGTREGGSVWGAAWAQAGLVVVHLQHAGSDLPAVRAAASSFADQAGLRSAATGQQLLARLNDVSFALNEIERRHVAKRGRWGSARPTQIGLSGHSFGAHTTLGMAGQRYPSAEPTAMPINEPRLASFIAFSPTVPVAGDAQAAFAEMERPLLSITGSRDADVAGVGATPERRFAVFAALPAGAKAHLVLQDADHMTFAGQTGRAVEIVRRQPITRDLQAAHHALVARITTDWWRATLVGDVAARARLVLPTGLASGDLWQQK